jgi:hypothetical protein
MVQLHGVDCSRLTMLFIVYDHVQAEYGCHVLVDRGVKQNFPEYHRTRGGGGSYGPCEDTDTLAEEDAYTKAFCEEDDEDDDDRAFIGGGDDEHPVWDAQDDAKGVREFIRKVDQDAAYSAEQRAAQALRKPREDRADVERFHGRYREDYDRGTAGYRPPAKQRVEAPCQVRDKGAAGPAGSYISTQAGSCSGQQAGGQHQDPPRNRVVYYNSNGEPVVEPVEFKFSY